MPAAVAAGLMGENSGQAGAWSLKVNLLQAAYSPRAASWAALTGNIEQESTNNKNSPCHPPVTELHYFVTLHSQEDTFLFLYFQI